ncbi:MAG: hypothetical protein KTR20_02310 [Cellvibrionaceae bacterium]|nr:hypothetical protein [Cellvibrionaceae bacterium]
MKTQPLSLLDVMPLQKNRTMENTLLDTRAIPMADDFARIVLTYNERIAVFTLIDQLNRLCRGVQRHRGLSIGVLAGNAAFAAELARLQQQLTRRVKLLAAFSSRTAGLLANAELDTVHMAWDTICHNWQQDSLLENFEYHSHFVEQLLRLVASLARRVQTPYGQSIGIKLRTKTLVPSSQGEIYSDLLNFSGCHLPVFIELLGKVRALSVHVAASGNTDADIVKKLDYLLQCIEQEKAAVCDRGAQLQQLLDRQLPSMLTVKIHEYKLDGLLNKIKNELLSDHRARVDAQCIFSLASDVMDVYWACVNDSVDLLRAWHDQELEIWLLC